MASGQRRIPKLECTARCTGAMGVPPRDLSERPSGLDISHQEAFRQEQCGTERTTSRSSCGGGSPCEFIVEIWFPGDGIRPATATGEHSLRELPSGKHSAASCRSLPSRAAAPNPPPPATAHPCCWVERRTFWTSGRCPSLASHWGTSPNTPARTPASTDPDSTLSPSSLTVTGHGDFRVRPICSCGVDISGTEACRTRRGIRQGAPG
jgi:hypothetical protein